MIKENNKAGFTLVELAIVLVIIGLIVGGVLVGQDLIKAATIRATVTDIEKFNAAATTFRGKYQGYPGDLVNTKALEFGFNTASGDAGRDGTAGKGDGNGLLEGGSTSTTLLGFETALFWVDLTKAGLIPARSTLTSVTATAQAGTNPVLGAGILPKAKLRDSALFTVFSQSGRNFYAISAFSATAGALTTGAALSPLEARGIDEKLDDGVPTTGVVSSITAITTSGATADAAAGTCMAGTAPFNYAASTDAVLNAIGCSIQVRASF